MCYILYKCFLYGTLFTILDLFQEQEADRTNRCFEGKLKFSHHRNEHPVLLNLLECMCVAIIFNLQMKIELIRGVADLPVPKKRIVRTSEMCTVTTLKR